MIIRRHLLLRWILLALFLLSCTLVGQSDVVNIGIVLDGPWERNSTVKQEFVNEITELTRGEFGVQFPEQFQLIGDWSRSTTQSQLEQLLNDAEVDMVIALGVIASNELAKYKRLPKPSIAPVIVDVDLQDLPQENGSSGVKNLSYIAIPSTAQRDAKVFREITPFNKLTMLLNPSLLESIPGFGDRFLHEVAFAVPGVTVEIIPVRSADQLLAELDDNIEALYMAPLLHLPSGDFARIIEGINERGIPSFSLFGRPEVERGVLAGLNPDIMPRLARRVAINVQRILLGDEAGSIPYAFAPGQELTVNMNTARKIGVFPPWSVITEAVLIESERTAVTRQINLEQAIFEGIEANLDLMAKAHEVNAGAENIAIARSNLLPSIDLSLTGVQIDADRAGTLQAEQTLSGAATLTQLIYSDGAWANYSVQKDLQTSLELDRDVLKLDIVQAVANAYLQLLTAKTLERIQTDNLRLSRENLDLARVRESVGYSGRAEVFRWESQIAQNRRDVIEANSIRNVAEIQVNRLLNRPLEESFLVEEATLSSVGILSEQGRLFRYMENQFAFRTLRGFFVEEGVKASPEVQALDAAIAVQERLLTTSNRALFLPDVALQGEFSRIFARGGEGSEETTLDPNDPNSAILGTVFSAFDVGDDNNWSVALNASFPLLRSGGKLAERRQALETLNQLRTQRKSVVEKIEQRIRSAGHLAGASYAAIQQSQASADAAGKNLDLVIDAYTQGALSITDLLDAQNAALVAQLAAESSIFEFLIDLIEWERSTGQLHVLRSDEEKAAFFDTVDAYFETAGIRIR